MIQGLQKALEFAAEPARARLTEVNQRNQARSFERDLQERGTQAEQPRPVSAPNPFNPSGGVRTRALGEPVAAIQTPPAARLATAQEKLLANLERVPPGLRRNITSEGLYRFGDIEINPGLVRELDAFTGAVHFEYATGGPPSGNANILAVNPGIPS